MMAVTFKSDVFDIFSDPLQFPAVIFGIDERGPGVAFRDFDELYYADVEPKDLDTYLRNLAISYISAVGQGHSYLEGVYDLPAGNQENYRLILISFYIGNEIAMDSYNFHNYYQMGLFIPTPLSQLLPALSSVETFVLANVKKILEGSFFLTVDKIQQIKREILALFTFVIFENMKRCDC
ncbi:MAG: hypothetical protein ACXAD7_22600 [Candidatus Kariarchaeaceae archaeon]|jgi:hypothetical protein